MLTLRRAEERGRANFGWLDSRHSFSFGSYFDPAAHGLRSAARHQRRPRRRRRRLPAHPHADMEIVSYVLDGALEHKDSLGTGSVIRPGDVQRMSAGSGHPPQRVQRVEDRARALPADLDRAREEGP